jgi:TPR repeat protein
MRRARALGSAGALALACASLACAHVYGPYPEGFRADADRRDCDAGNGVACARLGNAHVSGYGVPADNQRAKALFQRACDLGDLPGCIALAVQLEDEPDPGPQRAFDLFRSTCDRGSSMGCRFLGYCYAGVSFRCPAPRDEQRAHALFDHACAMKDVSGCETVARDFLATDRGHPPDPAAGAAYLRKACDLESGRACWDLGWMTSRGEGVPADEEEGKRLIERGCALGASGCTIPIAH